MYILLIQLLYEYGTIWYYAIHNRTIVYIFKIILYYWSICVSMEYILLDRGKCCHVHILFT